ncbi:thymidylate kinase [Pararhodospirillum oryzae]|uniref:Thymidylate kinase n=1 Tax=Pararhodospirillum oryzae TaxID=478448 RepID=A0A512H3W9_9PROT|nr:thymidylate kinase [Pararhodospirillum oryzae]
MGKTTQRARLITALGHLRSQGDPLSVLATREPGGAPGAEAIRALLVAGDTGRWDARTEALLHAAARRDHLVRTVWPALAAGTWVVSDRFADSTRVYQGAGMGVSPDDLERLIAFVCQEFQPDLTVILDLPAARGLERAARRQARDGTRPGTEDRYERLDAAFHERVRAGFLALAAQTGPDVPRRVVIDADADEDTVHRRVLAAVRDACPELEEAA